MVARAVAGRSDRRDWRARTGAGRTTLVFSPAGAPALRVHAYVPRSLSRDTRALVVMHGRVRNARDYLEAWAAWAERADRLVLAPEFRARDWPGSRAYNLGNVFSRGDARGSLTPPARWAFTVVEALHDEVRRRFGLDDDAFELWGHSAGGQFVHRLLLFRPGAPVRRAVAAGCGWFTAPEPDVRFPYGTSHPKLRFGEAALRAWLRKPLVLMRGTNDTARDPELRTTTAADRQGGNRYERSAFMLAAARSCDDGTRWRLVDVVGVAHDAARMAAAAQRLPEAP
jgi:poly(3-hydroxybutyrate) depolymerase